MTAFEAGFNTVYYYLAWKRQRAPYNQVTHVVIRCDVDESADIEEESPFCLTLGITPLDERVWDYRTLWMVATTLLRRQWSEINILALEQDALPGGTEGQELVRLAEEPARQVWPGTFKAAPRAHSDGPQAPAGRREASASPATPHGWC